MNRTSVIYLFTNALHKYYLRSAIILFAVLFGMIKIRVFHHSIRTSDKFDFCLDDILSNDSIVEIKDFVFLNKNHFPEELISKFLMHFEFVSKLSLKKHEDSLKVIVKSSRPKIKVNDAFVIAENKKLISVKIFRDDFIQKLPLIKSKIDFDKELLNFISDLNSKFFYKYDIEIEDSSKIWLRSKKNGAIILTCKDVIPDAPLLKVCKKLLQKKAESQSKNKHFVADIRFNEQIVLFQN